MLAIRAAMTFRQKLSSLAAAALLVPSIAAAREQASKYHYDGIYKGTIPIGLLTNESDNRRAKAQLVFYPDGRLLVLSVESPQARNPVNIKGTLKKNVFTGEWKKSFFGSTIAFHVVFHGGSAVAAVTGKNAKPEKWYFSNEKAGGSREKKKAADGREMGGAGLKKKWGVSEEKPSE
jgi:hypothetical protein